jgi:response regulator RpfG family c-di-GMP phosphodiesterase
MSDLALFAVESPAVDAGFKVLIADDDPEVHAVTKLVLSNFRLGNRGLQLLDAYSAAECMQMLREQPDIALVLLDVVMETDRAGLDCVRFIREELCNPFVRIVLRTGQPGQAPEQEVIANYDINDYKDKTELTAQKLATTLYASLRAYRDIMIIEANKRGLEKVIDSSANIFSQHHRQQFAQAVLMQLTSLLRMETGALYCTPAKGPEEHFIVAAGTGNYERFVRDLADERLPNHIVGSLREAYHVKRNVYRDDHYVLHFTDRRRAESLLYVGEVCDLSPLDYQLIEVFCTNVSIAFENLHLNEQLIESQAELVYLLAGAIETRSRETASHVHRVARLCEMLALGLGLDQDTAETLKLASPLHDLGKIGIPDAVLNKPGLHTAEETRVMREHAEIGWRMLKDSARPILRTAAEIALSHHENWDGTGYPSGLLGDAIPLSGRITALADVYDALGSKRCYKEPWPEPAIREFITEQRGRKFDPALVDLLFEHWEAAQAIRAELPD